MNSALRATPPPLRVQLSLFGSAAARRPRAALRARIAGMKSALRATPQPLRGQLSLRLRRHPPPAPRSTRAPRE
eukprot:scaffold88560_cov61-Phaeocystis_antarctica.AAC.2